MLGSCFVVLATMRPPLHQEFFFPVVHDDPQAVVNVQFGCKVHSRVIGVRLWSCRQGGRTVSEGNDAGERRNGALDLHI